MEILSTNFEENLGLLFESIESAEFISLDTEFTGLFNREEDEFDESDSLEERYRKLRSSCEEFWMCQLGICTYSLDSESNSYSVRAFSIYTIPSSPNHPMSIHPSSMKFLVDNNFDMNKLFKYGVCCARIREANLSPVNNKKTCYQLGSSSEALVMTFVSTILDFVNSKDSESIAIDVPSKYVKGLLQGPAGALRHFKNLKYHIAVEENRSVMKISKTKGKEPIFCPPQREKVMTGDDEAFGSLGASVIFSAILKAGVPLVLHNSLFDLGYMYTHFVDGLSPSLDQFKCDIRSLFPPIYDTKTIAKSVDIPALNRVNLEGLYRTCLHSGTFKDTVRFCIDEPFQEFISEGKCHDAAYDAYITGVAFLHLREYLRKSCNGAGIWDGVEQFKNLICLNKSSKYFLNLNFSVNNDERNENIIKFKLVNPMDINLIGDYMCRFGDVFVRKIADNEYIAKFDRYHENTNISLIIQKLRDSNRFFVN